MEVVRRARSAVKSNGAIKTDDYTSDSCSEEGEPAEDDAIQTDDYSDYASDNGSEEGEDNGSEEGEDNGSEEGEAVAVLMMNEKSRAKLALERASGEEPAKTCEYEEKLASAQSSRRQVGATSSISGYQSVPSRMQARFEGSRSRSRSSR